MSVEKLPRTRSYKLGLTANKVIRLIGQGREGGAVWTHASTNHKLCTPVHFKIKNFLNVFKYDARMRMENAYSQGVKMLQCSLRLDFCILIVFKIVFWQIVEIFEIR